jgi:hypothetical protein
VTGGIDLAQRTRHFVGRSEELASLEDALDGLDARRSGAIQVTGEPGIGKTRLLAELAARADRRGHLALSGSASEFELDLPFWVFVDALDEYVRGLDPKLIASLNEDVGREMALVLPALATPDGAKHAAPQHERYRIHRAVGPDALASSASNHQVCDEWMMTGSNRRPAPCKAGRTPSISRTSRVASPA